MSGCIPASLRLCGTEVANAARLFAYKQNGLFPPPVVWGGALPANANLLAPGVFASYSTPATDPAPWYDPGVAASAGFLGFLTDEVSGYDSVASRVSTDRGGYLQGASFNRERLAARVHEWSGTLIAQDRDSLEYGKRWLSQVLGASCDTCGVCDMEVRLFAPDLPTSFEDGRWLQYEVVTLTGPYYTDLGDFAARATFTLSAGNPYLYQEPILAIDNQPLAQPVGPGGCLPFDEWLCGILPEDNVCLHILPPRIGEYAPIVTLDATLGAASGVQITMYDDCPAGEPPTSGGRGITVPRLELGWKLVIDSAKGIINATNPDGDLVNGTSLVRADNHADPFLRIRDCDNTGCICIGVQHPCNGGDDTFVSLDYQLRQR